MLLYDTNKKKKNCIDFYDFKISTPTETGEQV